MLGQLVSMRDEEVLHAVHGRICLCWCVFFFPFLCLFFSFFEREEGRSVVKASLLLPYVQRQDHRHSCAAEAITFPASSSRSRPESSNPRGGAAAGRRRELAWPQVEGLLEMLSRCASPPLSAPAAPTAQSNTPTHT